MSYNQLDFGNENDSIIGKYFNTIDNRLIALEKKLKIVPIALEEKESQSWSTRSIFNALTNINIRITTLEESLSLQSNSHPSSVELMQLAKRIKTEQTKTDLFIMFSPILFRLTNLEVKSSNFE